jgi:uncharacterized protein with von Willebrand factor type A (vWA) domain
VTERRAPLAVRQLFKQLQLRGFAIGPPDLLALVYALQAGFGWASREALCELMVALWAKSKREAQVLRALFAQAAWPDEWAPEAPPVPAPVPPDVVRDPLPRDDAVPPGATPPQTTAAPTPPVTARTRAQPLGALPTLSLEGVRLSDKRLVFVEQFPLSAREIAQAFRQLRRPSRVGPAVELDLEATLQRRSRSGVATPPVLQPRRVNTARLAIFVDVQGSMAPYGPFVEAFCDAVREAGLLQQTRLHYFHDVPASAPDRALLDELPASAGLYPSLDSLLARLAPVPDGHLYLDSALLQHMALRDALQALAPGTVALVISDAGAARGDSDVERLQDCLAFVKALRQHATNVVWINPVPRALWGHSVAAQLARHVPMLPLDKPGLHQAVNTLRGQPMVLERAL